MIAKTSKEREDILRTYFRGRPDKPRLLAAGVAAGTGSLLCLSGLSLSSLPSPSGDLAGCAGCAGTTLIAFKAVLGATGLLAIGGKWSAYREQLGRADRKIRDSEVQRLLEDGLERLTLHALRTSGIGHEELASRPLVITGPILWNAEGLLASDLAWCRGRDGIVRFGVYRVTIILLAPSYLAVYSCDYNLIKDAVLNQTTEEYQYRNIVAVSTADYSASYVLLGGEMVTNTREFRVSVASSETIRVVVDSQQIRQITGVEALPESGAERAMRAIQALIKDQIA